MRNKKVFNNIFDSICMTSLLIVCVAFYLLTIWFGVINFKEGTNPIATMISATALFGTMTIITTILIIKYCYEYWVLSEDLIYSKKLFRKKVVINLNEIDKIEKKIVPALVLCIYSKSIVSYSSTEICAQ